MNVDEIGASVTRGGAIFATSGIGEDGWCEPTVAFKVGANARLAVCELDLWLKAERGRQRSHFRMRAGTDNFEFDLPHDVPVRVQIACRAAAGSVISIAIECDNEVAEKGGDVRPLSFKLRGIAFS